MTGEQGYYGIAGFFLVLALVTVILNESCGSPTKVRVHKKEGESCLIEQKCKVIVTHHENGFIFHRCLVNSSFYNELEKGMEVPINLGNCEKLNP